MPNKLLLTLLFLAVPEAALAWGPMTHAYLAGEIFNYAPLLPPAVWIVIKNFKQDFLYGNLMADMIIGKKFQPEHKQSHNWDFAMNLMDQAFTPSEKSFMYGFLCHLAADTVAHNELITEHTIDIEHTWKEFLADSIVDGACRLKSLTIKKTVQRRNDLFLKKGLPGFLFSFNTHKRIFKGLIFLSALTKKNPHNIDRSYIERLRNESMLRMIDVLNNGRDSRVLKMKAIP